jgi:aldehyde dehydrogenase (NAD+)
MSTVITTSDIKDDVSVVKTALLKTKKQFASGKTRDLSYRIAQLNNLKKGLNELDKDLKDAVTADLGREGFVTWLAEISLIHLEIEHTIANLKKWTKPVSVDTPMFLGPAKSKIAYEPLGVVCIMGSWNFPLFTTLLPLVGVIAAGNCAVVKPSEIAPHSLRKIKSLFARFLDTTSYACVEG